MEIKPETLTVSTWALDTASKQRIDVYIVCMQLASALAADDLFYEGA